MRRPYCTGCGTIFDRMHVMMDHRRTMRCGGRFLPETTRQFIDETHDMGFKLSDLDDMDVDYHTKVDVSRPPVHKERTPGTPKPYPKHVKYGARRKAQEAIKNSRLPE